jgi:hydroxymethylglutaryl-CoA reductase
MFELSAAELSTLRGERGLDPDTADRMIENAIGVFALPIGLGLNLTINGRDYVVPMVVEEPSVVAAISFAGKIVREAGGFTATDDPSLMIGQVQVVEYGDAKAATERVLAAKDRLLALANGFLSGMVRRGGGAKDIEVRTLAAPEGAGAEPLLIVHVVVDTRDAMGANIVNTVAEGVAPLIAELSGGKVCLRILSNLADRRVARASCRVPVGALADFGFTGDEIAAGIVQASRFASADPYRAATHNKGIMNGIDAVAIATGQDWRALEAGAHAFACRDGRYGPLSTWETDDGHLVGRIELPLAVGTEGGAARAHPGVRAALGVLQVGSARELATVLAAVGLAQNFAALRALGSVGIQKGHMALHARCLAASTGKRGKARRGRR